MTPRDVPVSLALVALLVALLLTSAAVPFGAEAQAPPDVVVLRDGTMFRGTLVERGVTRVVLLLPTGETREFAGSDVASAGPDTPAVVPAPSAVVPPPPSVRLHVRGTEPGRTLHRLTGSVELPVLTRAARPRVDAMEPLCAAPCSVDIPAGTYVFGVSEGDGSAHRAGPPVHLEAGERWVEIEHTDRTGTRVAGWVVVGLGAAAGVAIGFLGATSGGPGATLGEPSGWLGWDGGVWLGIGIGTAAVFTLIGTLIGITPDEAGVTFESSPPPPPPVVPEEREEPAPRRPRHVEPDAY